jgi:hypothetical protein
VLDHDRAQSQDRVERDDVLRAVRQDDRDRVAGADALVAQSRGRALDRLMEFAVRRRAAEEFEGGRVRIVPR